VGSVRSSFFVLAAVALTTALAPRAHGQTEHCDTGYACEPDDDWTFVEPSRHVKVVLLAGSIGAFQDGPYAHLIHDWCGNVEIRNLSRVGFGTQQLYGVFQREVLRHRTFPWSDPSLELWLLWNGGLNSAIVSARSNRYIRRAFVDAHARHMRVVGLSLTPWGAFDDARWTGARALETHDSTQRIVDFVMGRGDPADLLGAYASDRGSAPAAYQPEELADVRVDLYDSDLRDRSARARDLVEMRRLVSRDGRWRHAFGALPDEQRAARLDADAARLSEMGRWFLRSDFRSFDDVHPNRQGHHRIAELVCPSLPASWGCHCP
jgi:hypothetical protein